MADNPAIFWYCHSKTVERVVFLHPATKLFAYDWVPLGLVMDESLGSDSDAEDAWMDLVNLLVKSPALTVKTIVSLSVTDTYNCQLLCTMIIVIFVATTSSACAAQ